MKRREFLKKSTLISIGGILIPSSIYTSCAKKTLFDGLNYGGKVIIIGAGAAGLYAGYLLKSKGIDFQILEASSIHGGRMGKLSGFADYDIDTGAQWLHGVNNIAGDLIKKNNVLTTVDESIMKYWFNDQLVDSLPKDPFIFAKEKLPDVSFKDYATQQGFGEEYQYIIEGIAGDQGASAGNISALWNNKDEENWVSGDDDFKFRKTFFDLVNDYIAQTILPYIQYNTAISSIDYSSDSIVIKDTLDNTYNADKVIVTVPISILKLNEINFTPTLPQNKTEAFSKFGMEAGMKVFLKFNTNFYAQNILGGSVCAAYADDTVGKVTNDHILLAFVMGEQAASLNSLGSDDAITNALLEELDLMYNGEATANFISSAVFDYTDKPFIKGAYAYSTINMGDARKIAAQPIDNKLFFGGEAMNTNGHHQSVHGAIESGYKAVIDILTNIPK